MILSSVLPFILKLELVSFALALEVSVCYVMLNSTSKQWENGFDLHTETSLQGL